MKLFILTFSLLLSIFAASLEQFQIDGKVLELNDINFIEAISSFEYIFVDFYAPWCRHCKSLSPQLDKAAPILAQLKKPIVIAKLNADKYKDLATKYEIDRFPTLMVFINGVPTDYFGPRRADLLVGSLKKFVSPDVSILTSDSDISDFIHTAGTEFPIFIGFGLNESVISSFATQHKEKAWFSVAKDFSEDAMVVYDFNKVPALVALNLKYDEKSIFYGPFEDKFLEDFVKQNLLPLVVPFNKETVVLLKDDDRKIVVMIMKDSNYENTKEIFKLLKAAASANRDLVFGYVGFNQWEGFAESFEVTKETKLPKMVVWDGGGGYLLVNGSDSIEEGNKGSQITRFLEGYREGRVIQKQLSEPSFKDFIKSLFGIRTVYIFIFVMAVMILLRNLGYGPEEAIRVPPKELTYHQVTSQTTSGSAAPDSKDLSEKKDD